MALVDATTIDTIIASATVVVLGWIGHLIARLKFGAPLEKRVVALEAKIPVDLRTAVAQEVDSALHAPPAH